MSIQERINFNVGTKDGRYLHSFVISGETGPADVPEGVHVRFYGCSITSLTCRGKNGIFIEGGTCGPVTATLSKVAGRGVAFSGDSTLTESDGEFFACTVAGKWSLKQKSYLRPDATQFSGSAIAMDLDTGSQARATRCTFSGHGTSAVKAQAGSYALLSKCSLVQGAVAALWALDSLIEAVECALVQGTGAVATKAEGSGRVECHNCQTVKGATQAGKGEGKGFLLFNQCQTILGEGSSAVLLDGEARADIRSFQTLKGQGDSALKCLSKNYAYVADGLTFQSDAKDAVEAAGESSVEVVSVTTTKGVGRHGASLSGKAKASFLRCTTVQGAGGHGLNLSGESRASLSGIQDVLGQAGHGIMAIGASKVDGHSVQNVLGQAGHGVSLSGASKAILKAVAQLIGQAGHGAALSGASSILLHSNTLVKGNSGDGVAASDGCSVQIARCGSVIGAAGNGVSLVGGGALHVSDVEVVHGASGHGILGEGGVIRLAKVTAIRGASGDGINVLNPDLEARNCDLVEGSENGVTAVGRGPGKDRVLVDGCASVQGASVGYAFGNVKAVTRGGTITAPTALQLDSAHLDTTMDTFSGDAVGVASILEVHESTISGDVSWEDMSIMDRRGSHGASLSMAGVGMVMTKTTLPDNSADGCGLVAAQATLGETDTSGGGVVLAGGAGAVKGDGAAVSLNAGTPEDGVDYVAMNTGVVKAQDQDGSYVRAAANEVQVSSTDGSTITVTQDIVDDAAAAFSAKGATTAKVEGTTLATVKSAVQVNLEAPVVDVV